MVRLAHATLLLATLAACDVGSVGPNPGDDTTDVDAAPPSIDAPPTPTVAVAVTPPSVTTTLGTESTFTVALTSSHFTGAVNLAATGAPAGWVVTITPTSLSLTDGGSGTATVKVRVPSNGTPAPTGQALTITATGAGVSGTGPASLAVTNEYIINVGSGAGGGTHWGAMNGGTIRLKAGTRLHIRNDDIIAHRVHTGGGVAGFDHQGSDMGPGGSFDVTPTSGSDIFYCHDHGQGTGEVNLVIE